MEFVVPGSAMQYSYASYLDDESIRNHRTPLDYEITQIGKESSLTAFRHQALSASIVDLNRSYSNEGRHFQSLAPSLISTFHMEHSLDGQYSAPEWPLDYEVTRAHRYMSPNGPHGGSLSESSASSESAYTPDAQSYPIHFSRSHSSVPGQYTFKALEYLPPNPVTWTPEPPNSYVELNTPLSSTYALHISSFSPKDLHFQQVDDLAQDHSSEEDTIHVNQDSPMQRPEPEELDLTSVNTDSTLTSTSETDQSETEQVEAEPSDDDSMAIDDNHSDSDPDFDIRPRRRTNSRGTTSSNKRGVRPLRSPKHARRTSNLNRSTVIDEKARIHKSRPSSIASSSTSTHARKLSKSKPRVKPDFARKLEENAKQEAIVKTDRPFPCTFHHFGCSSEFPNKNEWKRHVAFQHLQLGYFRCDLDNCNPDNKPAISNTGNRRASSGKSSKCQKQKEEDTEETIKIYNDFNRKDLFTQHCRRMHGPSRNAALCSNPPNKRGTLLPTKDDNDAFEDMLHDIRRRCWHVRRQAPSRSVCGFCDRVFDADAYQNLHGDNGAKDDMSPEEKAWEARMEHIGRHYEKDHRAVKEIEAMDEDLRDWGVRNDLLQKLEDGRAWLVNVGGSPDVSPCGAGTSNAQSSKTPRAKHPRKARRPSKTIEIHKRARFEDEGSPVLKTEDPDSDDDAEAESDPAVN